LYEAPETLAKNFLCLAADGGKLYAGTDSGGLVFEIDPAARAGRVILDAEEEEISAVVPDGAGGLFVATADASKAGPDGAPAAPRGDSSGKAVDAPAPPTAPRPADDADNADAPATRPAEPRGDKPPPASAPAPKGAATAPSKDTPPREPASAPAAALAARAIAPAGKLAEPASKPRAPAARRAAPRARPPAAAAEETGNAVYHILPGGLVQTIFRRPVLILAMIRQDGRLILGTGNGGEIHSVSTDGDEIVRLADTDAKQVTALAIRGRDVLFATANKGSLAGLSSARAPAGTFTSAALDAAQIARWGTVRVEAATPAGAKLLLSTRSGNVSDPDDKTWSAWSKDQPVTGAFAPVASPPARFLQYRLTLAAAGDAAPAVREVEIVYQVGNLPPAVTAVKVTPNAQGASREQNTGGPLAYRHVEITAADPNNDPLTFDIAFREAGGETWVTIAEKHKEPKFVWDTRTVGDGKYELRVTASDASANPPGSQRTGARVSEIVVADNTAPVVRELLAKPDGRTIRLTGQAADALSRIATLAYCVDSQDDWTPVAPADGICDSPKEAFAAEIADLKPGAHRIAVRVTDALGNVGYASVNVTVK
ncbi:MAG TPA: hypothetical protein PK082_05590, partial [Phycisphaerae bacterium]|nr:hypothetical protein [Phycisphaerae bacterium]